MPSDKITLKEWVRRLSEEEFPLFAHTARSIASLSSSEGASVQELAQVILGDNTMTARVLRMSNSAHYSPGGKRINTVSRAIVLLGFNVVRSIALSVSLIDTILSGDRHDAALGELVKSFHAAVQAKEFSRVRHSKNEEEIFIAALLNRLGSVAFWCFPYGKDAELSAAYKDIDDSEKAEKSVLGFTLTQLTSALAKEWSLSRLLMGALSSTNKLDKNVLDIEYGFRLANALEKGWDTPEVQKVIGDISDALLISHEEVRAIAYKNSQEAIRMIEEFGIRIASQFIPEPPSRKSHLDSMGDEISSSNIPMQLDMLRELSTMLSEQVDMNMVLGTVLEGVYRSLKMDRVVLAFTNKNNKRLVTKFSLGKSCNEFSKQFDFSLEGKENVFSYILESNQALWMDRKMRSDLGPLLTPVIYDVIGQVEFFAMPVRIGGKPRGIIYADRSLTRDPLDKHEFLTFNHFCEQANIAFAILGR